MRSTPFSAQIQTTALISCCVPASTSTQPGRKTPLFSLTFWSMLLGNEVEVCSVGISFQMAVCPVLKECFLVESVIKARLIDWEEYLLKRGSQKGLFSPPMSCCCFTPPLYSGTLLFCLCFAPKFSTPGECCCIPLSCYLDPSSSEEEIFTVGDLLVICILQPP